MKLQLIFDEKPRGGGGIGASAQIAKTLHQQGIDTTTLLYDEALELATGGDFSSAAERLQMLLCLNPSDGGSQLLLAKILAAKKEWQQAIFQLKKSSENGHKVPKNVRTFVDQGLQRELRNTDIERKRALQRDRTELNQLKNEIRRLRSKNSNLNNENVTMAGSLRSWMYLTAIISGCSMAILFYNIFSSGPKEESIQTEEVNEAIVDAEKTDEQIAAKSDAKEIKTRKKKTRKTKKNIQKTIQAVVKNKKYSFPLKHTIGRGDSYGKMAEKYYGSHRKWQHIESHTGIPANQLKSGASIEIPPPPSE